jgi:peptide/nickel transport system permease protein
MRTALPRFARSMFALWALLSLTFVISTLLPSDPARIAAGPQARPADVAAIRSEMGLDEPIRTRYARFLRRVVHVGPRLDATPPKTHASCAGIGPIHLDLGRSYQQRRPVLAILMERLPRTALLAVVSVFLQLLFGVTLGTWATSRRGRWARRFANGVMNLSLVTISFPTFALGVMLQYIFAHRLGWLPIDGYGKSTADHAVSVILPAFTLGIYGMAYYARLTREELAPELRRDYVRTARAKGASSLRVLIVHALRNVAVPVSTAAALELGGLLGGAIVTESIFRWPGIGSLAMGALLDRDMPVLMGTVVLTALAVMVANASADRLARRLDPRL